jgi:hypothetical protein
VRKFVGRSSIQSVKPPCPRSSSQFCDPPDQHHASADESSGAESLHEPQRCHPDHFRDGGAGPAEEWCGCGRSSCSASASKLFGTATVRQFTPPPTAAAGEFDRHTYWSPAISYLFADMPSKDPFTGVNGLEPRALSGTKRSRSQNCGDRVSETRRIRDVPFEERFSGGRDRGSE